MQVTLPLHRFEEFGPLNAAERAAIASLGDPSISVERRRIIWSEGVKTSGFYLLLDGWAAAAISVPDGGRQILKVNLPGDVLGSVSMSSDHAVETLSALTDVTVSFVPFTRFGAMIEAHPRLAVPFLLSAQLDHASLMDQLASIGRTSADARLAAFLLDLADRLRPLGAVDIDTYDLPMSQDEIADVLSLTPVHVNRTLRTFDRDQLIRRNKRTISIIDRRALTRLAARRRRPLRSDLSWLPKGR